MKKYRYLFAAAITFFAVITAVAACTEYTVSDVSKGYLKPDDLPDSLIIIPPPPARGSAGLALDEEAGKKNLLLQGTLRWRLATLDADLSFPAAAKSFSCALNAPVTEKDTPKLYRLMRRVLIDAGASTAKAKNKYRRTRPYLVNKEPTCAPDQEKSLKDSGSYPSGHTAIGWAWALILSEIAPDRRNEILARGRVFSESRIVCNFHWLSDVTEGYIVGSAVVSRLHADPAFRSDLEAAASELAKIRSKGLKPDGDCAAEAAALRY